MRKLLFAFALLLFPQILHAQNWAGVVDPSRAIDWSSAGISGGYPVRTTQCGSTLAAGSTAAQINAAIAACPANQFVLLGPGSFSIGGITFAGHNNVTLRGSGSNSTFLVFTGSTSCSGLASDICVFNGSTNPSLTANWTAGYAPGTTQITVSSTTGMQVGSLLILDQLDDSNTDTGNIWVCETTTNCSSEGPSGAGRSGRSQTQMVTVTNIAGSVVTITPPIYMPNWRTGQSPGLTMYGSLPITGDTIENLSMDHTGSGEQTGIIFFNAANYGVKGIRSINSQRNHIWLFQAGRGTIRDSYFYKTKSAASQSYGVEPFVCSDVLIENNIFQQVAAPITVNGSCSGLVSGYNYSIDNFHGATSSMFAMQWLHASGVDMELFEGNIGAQFAGDSTHGTHHMITLFRNYWIGWEQGMAQQTWPIAHNWGTRYTNNIGNVLGRSGYHNNYQGTSDTSIWGNMGACCGVTGPPSNDTFVVTSAFRWGNYDTVTAAVRFCIDATAPCTGSEVPSGLSPYGNAVPVSHTLPASFYLSAKPAWFGSIVYPPIGPDVTGGTVDGNNGSSTWAVQTVGGHANDIPALNCYKNTMSGPADGTGSVLAFDANVCYAGSSQAATPSCLPGAGTYGMPQFVSCTDSSSGAIMCYTLDGTTPATNGVASCTTGTLYSAAISITVTETLKVIAGGTGFTDSAVLSNIYISGPAPAPAIFAGFMGNVSGQIFRPN